MRFTILLMLLLSGCSTLQDAVNKGAKVNDDVIQGADDIYCNIASIGSITRKFSMEEYTGLRTILCDKDWAKK